jgi:hypothetical protein
MGLTAMMPEVSSGIAGRSCTHPGYTTGTILFGRTGGGSTLRFNKENPTHFGCA